MKIIELSGDGKGVVEMDGARYGVDLTLIEDARLGDHVIVHAGFAIEKLDTEEADVRLALFEDMAKIYREEPGAS